MSFIKINLYQKSLKSEAKQARNKTVIFNSEVIDHVYNFSIETNKNKYIR